MRLFIVSIVCFVLVACAGNPVDKASAQTCREFFESGELETAKAVCQRAGELGYAEGEYYLAKMASNALEAYKHMHKANKISPRYQAELDQSYKQVKLQLEDLYTKKQYQQALEINRVLAADGMVLGQMNLAYSYRYGRGVQQDMAQALTWYQKARQNGSKRAAAEINNLSRQAFNKARQAYKNKNYAQAVAGFKELAAYGHVDALGYLADCYYYGYGVDKDLSQAAAHYRQAADLGGRFEAFRLASMMRKGEGGDKDVNQAFRYFEQAANAGYKGAYFYLGYAYANGQGTQRDYVKSRSWYAKAIKLKNANAANFNLAYLYQYGLGGPQDLAQATQLYSRFSPQDDKSLQLNLRDLAQMQAQQNQYKNSPVLFGQRVFGARRVAMRNALFNSGVKATREDYSYWADRYSAGDIFPGVKDLYVYYSHASDDNKFGSSADVLAELEYQFGRQGLRHIEEIKSLLAQKYGQPSSSIGRLSVGEMSYSWWLDGVEIKLQRSWPASELKLIYRVPKFSRAMRSEIKQQREKDKLKKYQGAKHAF